MTDRDDDLIDRLRQLARADSDRVLFIELLDGASESGRLTAGELQDRASAVAASLTASGISPGEVVLHIAISPIEFLIGLFGCMWAGVIAAPVAFPRRPEHLQTRLEPVRLNAGAVAVLAGTARRESEGAILRTLATGELPIVSIDAPAPAQLIEPAAGREIAYLQYTSGSTSDPKGVIVTHANLIANLECSEAIVGFDADTVNVSWCPLTHDMGLIMGALPSVAFGALAVLMPPAAFIRRPLAWLTAIDTYRGTHGYSPNFGYDLCVDRTTAEDRASLDLSTMRFWINGAEMVRKATGDRFLEAFAASRLRPESYAPSYGLAESTVMVSTSGADSSGLVVWVDAAALERDEVVFVEEGEPGARPLCGDGRPGPGYEVRIVDPETAQPAEPDRVGEVWLRGPSVCRGYWRRPAETEATFRAELAGDSRGPYLRTGDLGFMHEGELLICGRAKDLIILHGRNIYPQDIEVTAEAAHAAVRAGGSAAFAVDGETGESLVIIAEVDGEPDEAEVCAAIRAAVSREFELNVADLLLHGPQQTPKTSSGKKQRAASRALWAQARAVTAVSDR